MQRVAIGTVQGGGVLGADAQGAVAAFFVPAGIAYRRVAGIAAAFAGGQDKGELRFIWRLCLLQCCQFRQQFGDQQVDAVVRQADGIPAVPIIADREHPPGG